MNPVKIVEKKYQEGRFYKPDYGGPYPIEDWILIEVSKGWIKGAERILFDIDNYRIRFIYWKHENGEWRISRFHPVMDIEVVKELMAQMKLRDWI